MATVKLVNVYSAPSHTLAYIVDGRKTNAGILTTSTCSVAWDGDDAARAFANVKAMADARRGRGRRPKRQALHVIQAFAPGEITAEQAHALGVKLADSISNDGEFDYVIATHTDRDHIHNHLVINATSKKTLRQIETPRGAIAKWRLISDTLCRAHGLSVIAQPQPGARSIGETYARAKGMSTNARLAALIDEAVSQTTSFAAFTERLEGQGIQWYMRGRHILFRDTQTMRRAIRGARLGSAYTQEAIAARLGRSTMASFEIASRLIDEHASHVVRVHIPSHPQGLGILASRENLVQTGGRWRLYVPEHAPLPLLRRDGSPAGEILPRDLYNFFDRPTRTVSTPERQAPVARGKTEAQRRYFAMIDRKVAAFKERAAVINTRVAVQQMRPDEREDYLSTLDSELSQMQTELDQLILAQQKAYDEGDSFGIHTTGEALADLERTYAQARRIRDDLARDTRTPPKRGKRR